ncbi:hypothetical protein GFPCMMHI_05004 [Ensifer adhaerens]|nr:hypothetical protein [Ensifer adhaerens]
MINQSRHIIDHIDRKSLCAVRRVAVAVMASNLEG